MNAEIGFEASVAGTLTLKQESQSASKHAIFSWKIEKFSPTPSAPTAPRPSRLRRSPLAPLFKILNTPLEGNVPQCIQSFQNARDRVCYVMFIISNV